MSNTSITLKQIAEIAGVSITTVHRVLNNKEGCSEELKQKILRIAQDTGYTCNYVASATRRHTLHIALLFPARDPSFRYFMQWMLDGYLDFRADASKFNVIFQEYYLAEPHGGSLLSHMKNICNEVPTRYDGVVMYCISPTAEEIAMINRLIGRGIPVVAMEKFPQTIEGLCRVQADDVTAGRLAAELMAKFLPSGGTVAVVEQALTQRDPNGEAFVPALLARRPDLKTAVAPLPLLERQDEAIGRFLDRIPDLAGVYCTSARHTHAYLRVRGRLAHIPGVAIGSELFTESHAALTAGALDAVIDKRPYTIGSRSIELLFGHLVKGEPLPAQMLISPRVILQSNCDVYFARKEHPHDNREIE